MGQGGLIDLPLGGGGSGGGIDVDAVLSEINGWGRYQRLLYFLLCVPSIGAGAAVLALSWTGYNMAHRCFVPGCDPEEGATYVAPFLNFTTPRLSDPSDPTQPWAGCVRYSQSAGAPCLPASFNSSHQVACDRYVYDTSVMTSSVVSQFDLTCGSDWAIPAANSLYMGGMLVGSLLFGYLADKYGRKISMTFSFLVLGVAGTASAFAPNFTTFAAMRFFMGVGGMGIFAVTFVLAVELVSSEIRTFCGFFIELYFAFGACMVGVLAMFIRDWSNLQLTISLPVFLLLSFWFFVPESPRWLAAEGRNAEAEQVLRRAAEVNGTVYPDSTVITPDKVSTPPEVAADLLLLQAEDPEHSDLLFDLCLLTQTGRTRGSVDSHQMHADYKQGRRPSESYVNYSLIHLTSPFP